MQICRTDNCQDLGPKQNLFCISGPRAVTEKIPGGPHIILTWILIVISQGRLLGKEGGKRNVAKVDTLLSFGGNCLEKH